MSRFDPLAEEWRRPENWPRAGAVVLYARLDGGFSIWDPVRNRRAGNGSGERASGFLLSPAQVWEGMRGPDGVLCNGLLDDLLDWQFRQKALFASVRDVLARLSPDDVPLRLGEPVRLSVHDARDIPTLEMPYGAIPVVHASADIKRILGLAYLLVWAWHEHRQAARLAGEPGAQRLVLLIDEVDAHLHPRWQRMFLPALFEVVRNYRYASHWLNSCKSNCEVLDSYEVGEGWFEIHLPSLQLRLTDKVPDAFRPRARAMLDSFPIRDDERIVRQRRQWYALYRQGKLSLSGLREVAPLIAAAVDKQQAAGALLSDQ